MRALAGGSGLRGLADRVEARGGRLRIDSPSRAEDVRHRGDPVRVVIAEDSALLREGLARILTEGGFDVVAQAANADELHDAVRRRKPDVAVVDVRMPPDAHRRRAPGCARAQRRPIRTSGF